MGRRGVGVGVKIPEDGGGLEALVTDVTVEDTAKRLGAARSLTCTCEDCCCPLTGCLRPRRPTAMMRS